MADENARLERETCGSKISKLLKDICASINNTINNLLYSHPSLQEVKRNVASPIVSQYLQYLLEPRFQQELVKGQHVYRLLWALISTTICNLTPDMPHMDHNLDRYAASYKLHYYISKCLRKFAVISTWHTADQKQEIMPSSKHTRERTPSKTIPTCSVCWKSSSI
jgi:hypothetical protein